MLFKLTYEVSEENHKATVERFMSGGEKWDGLELIGRWHEAGKKGFMIVQADDMISLGKFANYWNDLCKTEVVPVMTDEDAGKVLMA